MKNKLFVPAILFVMLSIMLSACSAGLVSQPTSVPEVVESTPVPQESTPTFVATNTLEPTLAPTEVAPTQPAATEEAPVIPVAVSCDTPSIKAGLTAADVEFGEYLDTNLGRRMTFTSRRLIVPAKAWNEVLTADELLAVETTWQSVRVCIPEGTFGRIFAGGFEQGTNRYENGVLMTLNPGLYEFKMRNGEVVIWYPDQENFANSDLIRIGTQIIHGNFDIHAQLAFFATTADLLPQMPADLVKQNNVQIVPFPEPVTE